MASGRRWWFRHLCMVCWRWAGDDLLCRRHREAFAAPVATKGSAGKVSQLAQDAIDKGVSLDPYRVLDALQEDWVEAHTLREPWPR